MPAAPPPLSARIIPVILCGGAGARLWPLSRADRPKPLVRLMGEQTLLQQTARRATGERFAPPIVVAAAEHRFVVAEQLREAGVLDARIILEPVPRDTAPAVAVACAAALESDPDALILVMPADHGMEGGAVLEAALRAGVPAALGGRHVLFGIPPTQPSDAYGYIRRGSPLDAAGEVFAVDAFIEKPPREAAAALIATGDCAWNSGIFLLAPRLVLAELAVLEPELAAQASAGFSRATRDQDFIRLDADAFAACPAKSIDHALMEHTGRAAVTPYGGTWVDIGSWSALWDSGDKDADGNVRVGDVLALETTNAYLRGEGVLLATVGVHDLVVVATADAVLVAGLGADQAVKGLVDALRRAGRSEADRSPPPVQP